MHFQRVILMVLDSVGIGALPDAKEEGVNTLLHTSLFCGGLKLPTLSSLGLGNLIDIPGIKKAHIPLASYGRMMTKSKGNDTTTGHWELMGVITEEPFPTYPNGFSESFLQILEKKIGRRIIRAANRPSSGVKIIDEFGALQMKTGDLIVYTSADSVLQIAAHEDVVPLQELYDICSMAHGLTSEGNDRVIRVIARPYIGEPGNFQRTSHRRDFSIKPPHETVLDFLADNNRLTIGIGKISDIYAGSGIERSYKTSSNDDGMKILMNLLHNLPRDLYHNGVLFFINLVDFDMLYGHRRDPKGYGQALEAFDRQLPLLLSTLAEDDLLLIVADHGNDPTYIGTDHTREYVPLFCYQKNKKGKNLGTRTTLADVGATIATIFDVHSPSGESFDSLI